MKTHLKLGTRKSLLAWAQSSWVARTLIEHHQKRGLTLTVELVGIETQGDKILDKPLSQIEGKEFFTAELDRALMAGEVDFTVHSMKDLSLDRPAALKLAAIPKREFQHDVVIFHESVVDRIKEGKPIRVGTSSPRRLTLVPGFLRQALPRLGSLREPTLDFKEIRGNVNTRLGRIHEAEGTDRKLDGVILAFAGLERLAQDEKAALELAKLLEHTRMMVLPLRENPTAPAQGALAIEAQADAKDTLSLLSVMHDPVTLSDVTAEREVLNEWGGGCHQKLGASCFTTSKTSLLYIRGQKPTGEFISEIRGETPATVPSNYLKVETTDLFNFGLYAPQTAHEKTLEEAGVAFIAHARAFEYLPKKFQIALQASSDATHAKRIWVSGAQSWFKLAAQGLWIEGCVEGLGIKSVETFAAKKLLNFGSNPLQTSSWAFLTHAESLAMEPHFTFKIGVVPTYEHEFKFTPSKIIEATHLYWNSGLAFTTVYENLPNAEEKKTFLKKAHACGPGRTLMVLKNHGVEPTLIVGQD